MSAEAARNRAKLSPSQAIGFKLATLRSYKIGYIFRAVRVCTKWHREGLVWMTRYPLHPPRVRHCFRGPWCTAL